LKLKIIGCAAIASSLALVSCDNTVAISPNYLLVAISPRPASVPVGATVVFTGTVSNNLSLPRWSFLDASDVSNPGALTSISGSSDTILYTAPATPPIYSVTPTGVTQGTITLQANVSDPPGTSIPITADSITFVITAPSVTVGLAPVTANVALAGTEQFIGYAVGSVNNALTWQINGVTGGSSTTGSINTAGTYVAPASLPISGNTVTLTIVSQADPTKTASATITLQ
jgi:hypothetical protein